MSTRTARRPAVAIADAAARDLCERLGIPLLPEARPGAVGLLAPCVLLQAADGWVHPGPPTAWADFAAMVATIDRTVRRSPTGRLPDVAHLSAEAIDREAGEWQLPAVAVRRGPAPVPEVPEMADTTRVDGASVVVLGATWAAPLAATVLAGLGARVVRVTDPRRPDPFPLRAQLRRGQAVRPLDLGAPEGRAGFATLLADADLLLDGTTPRVLRNVSLDDTPTPIVRIAAFAREDRPGYGLAAEARGGWASRFDPPRLGRSSVADPIAGLLAVLRAVDVLRRGEPAARSRVSLEEAVGLLLEQERRDG
jgi:hypothetical protein